MLNATHKWYKCGGSFFLSNSFLFIFSRYPTKGRITTAPLKIVTLIQAELNDFVALDGGLQHESSKAMKAFIRCSTGMILIIQAWTIPVGIHT